MPEDNTMGITAIVLAGGRGSRMNHRDKAWVEFNGLPLIAHVINRVAPCVDDVIISRNEPNPGYEQWPYRCIADINEPGQLERQ